MKRDIVTGVLVLLVAITIFSVMRGSDVKNEAANLQKENDNLKEMVVSLETELSKNNATTEELLSEQKVLEEEIELTKSSIEYQEFKEAINTVESYKAAKTIKEAMEFILHRNGLGIGYIGGEGKCPCDFDFNGRNFEWVPHAVKEIKEFKLEGDKIILTYNTAKDITHNYRFVLAKGKESDQLGKWRIEVITITSKGNDV